MRCGLKFQFCIGIVKGENRLLNTGAEVAIGALRDGDVLTHILDIDSPGIPKTLVTFTMFFGLTGALTTRRQNISQN
jgi:hypothetical protein